ncbi:MAG: hypothetical protein R2784_10595 [Saprospiraceae bacterium]
MDFLPPTSLFETGNTAGEGGDSMVDVSKSFYLNLLTIPVLIKISFEITGTVNVTSLLLFGPCDLAY